MHYYFVIFQEARDELETQKDELRDLMTKLEADRDMELEERQKLEEEIRAKQEEIERLQNISTPNFSTLKFSTLISKPCLCLGIIVIIKSYLYSQLVNLNFCATLRYFSI